MQISKHRESCYSRQVEHYDSIIWINILGSDSLDACTCGGLYCSVEPLPIGFTLPHTRLAFKRLRPLSCQRLGPPATLTTWVNTLYVRLTNSLECQDAILLESLLNYIMRHHHEPSWNYVLTMRHHHELPLTRAMKLRPDQWGTTTKPSWNYILTNEASPWDLT